MPIIQMKAATQRENFLKVDKDLLKFESHRLKAKCMSLNLNLNFPDGSF